MIFNLFGVQTFAAISLNNPVYGQRSIMEMTRYIIKNTICVLH